MDKIDLISVPEGAPEGATHYQSEQRRYEARWFDFSNTQARVHFMGRWQESDIVIFDEPPSRFIPILKPWSGECPPPAGTECEYRVGNGTWYSCTIRYVTTPISDEEVQVVINCPHLNGDQIGSIGSGIGEINFRQSRTPEQIAAEERDKAVKAMLAEFEHTGSLTSHYEVCEVLHKAGYRKFETIDEPKS